ncbi:acyltransferase [Macrococcoides canis]|uniref:acyltransferase family protein n=1 Tax=Macrococcoides canis TaxID=1855823 RepID=UPI0020B83517|nr:acyltransferase [Macrococcus canis]UTH00873.1 acyltransferase [Macrococcus canis]UTH03238.1 acyltransferase [Macrococcus canis]
MKKERNTKIDILRAIAMICIIIAHSKPDALTFQLRNFDVIMIVILLGASFQLSMQGKPINYVQYIIKRFKRLILPTWIFLTVFFSFFYILSITTNKEYFTLPQIIESYKMLGGIGFLWIMKVFFIVALTSPLLLYISNRVKSHILYFTLLALAYIIYHILYLQLDQVPMPFNKYYNLILLEGIGYSIVTAIGIRLLLLGSTSYRAMTIISIILYATLALYYQFEPIQNFKYPPHLYYISYGMMMTLLMYRLLDIKPLHDKLNNLFIQFISKHSLWLYFWHILTLYILKLIHTPFNTNFFTRFIFIFGLALILTIIHNKIAKKIKHR